MLQEELTKVCVDEWLGESAGQGVRKRNILVWFFVLVFVVFRTLHGFA